MCLYCSGHKPMYLSVDKLLYSAIILYMDKQKLIQSILDSQQEIGRYQVLGDIDPWLELELSTPQLKALLIISGAEDGLRMRPFAERIGASTPYATGIVDRLVERGLVERMPHPSDRRVVLVRLTGEGREFLERLSDSMRSMAVPLLEQMDEKDLAALRQGLWALSEVSRSYSPEASAEAS